MNRRRRKRDGGSAVATMQEFRADFEAARSDRFKRVRTGIPAMGSGADYHYRSESQYLRLTEYARDLDRNDMVVGAITERAVDNELQCGFSVKFDSGDSLLDDALASRWKEESDSPEAIDFEGEHTFYDFERLTSRAEKVDGDHVVLLLEDGRAQMAESHRMRSPGRSKRRIVHGVELAENSRRRVAYWLTRNEISPFTAKSSVRVRDLQSYPKHDNEGFLNVLHLRSPKRCTQTRGVTAYAPIFDMAAMHDDIEFAELLRRQVVSSFAIFEKRPVDWQPLSDGGDQKETDDGGEFDLRPGMRFKGDPGVELEGFSPNIPGAEFFPHVKMILTFIGINLGVPLVLALMDGSETNFSGYRGAIDQAKIGFRRNQKNRIAKFYKPFTRHRIRAYGDDDPAIRKAIERFNRDGRAAKVKPYSHVWTPPVWSYIEPVKDATGDLIREANGMISPRRRHAERDQSFDDVARETVEDRAKYIAAAIEKANAINEKYRLEGADRINWERLAPLPSAQGVNISITESSSKNENSEGESS